MVQLCTASASCPLPGGGGSRGGSCFLHTRSTAIPSAVCTRCLLGHSCAITASATANPRRTRMRWTSDGPCVEHSGLPAGTCDCHCPCIPRTGMLQQTPSLASLCCLQRNPVAQAA